MKEKWKWKGTTEWVHQNLCEPQNPVGKKMAHARKATTRSQMKKKGPKGEEGRGSKK